MNWDKLREWIQALLMPAAVAAAGYLVAKSNATRESDARMIEIAAQVLAAPVSDSTRLLREWAAKELARHGLRAGTGPATLQGVTRHSQGFRPWMQTRSPRWTGNSSAAA